MEAAAGNATAFGWEVEMMFAMCYNTGTQPKEPTLSSIGSTEGSRPTNSNDHSSLHIQKCYEHVFVSTEGLQISHLDVGLLDM